MERESSVGDLVAYCLRGAGHMLFWGVDGLEWRDIMLVIFRCELSGQDSHAVSHFSLFIA